METETERTYDTPDKVAEVITHLQNGKAEDIQTIIDGIITMNAEQRRGRAGAREISNAAIRYLDRLLKGDVNNEIVKRILTLMHILSLQDGDLTYRDRLVALTRRNIQLGPLKTIDDARRFANICTAVDLSRDPDARKTAEWLIISFANNQALTETLGSLFKLSDAERKNLVARGQENFRNFMRQDNPCS